MSSRKLYFQDDKILWQDAHLREYVVGVSDCARRENVTNYMFYS